MSENNEKGSRVHGFEGSRAEPRTPETQNRPTGAAEANPRTQAVQTSGNDREIRLAKLAKLREAGVNPYAYKWDRTHTNAKAVAEFEKLGSGVQGSQGSGSETRTPEPANPQVHPRLHGRAGLRRD